MDDTSALAAPPPLTIHARGDAMSAVAEVLCLRLPGATLATDGGGRTADAPVGASGTTTITTHRGARPALVLLSAGAEVDEVRAALADVAAQHPRQARVWIGVDDGVDRDTLRILDEALDDPAQPLVDAVVVLPSGGGPAATALAVEAWIWLRHDAPSGALLDLRDENGACRFAAIGASAPAGPPARPAAASGAGPAPGAGEHAVLLIRRGLDAVEASARVAASERAARVWAAAGHESATEVVPVSPELDSHLLDRAVSALDQGDVAGLRAAQRVCAEESSRASVVAAADLAAAERAVVQADTTWQVESSRTGLAAKIGRRKRLEEARTGRERARRVWTGAYVEAVAEAAKQSAAGELAPVLAAAALAAEGNATRRTAEQRRNAKQRWLTEASGAASTVQLPAEVDQGGLSRAWGRAAPSVRRYLVVPRPQSAAAAGEDTTVATATAAGAAPGGVTVLVAPDLARPIAAALVMGVPLAALRINPSRGTSPS